jgi:hypothetical protein
VIEVVHRGHDVASATSMSNPGARIARTGPHQRTTTRELAMITTAETVFISAEDKLALAGSLESAYRALNSAWALWTAKAHEHAWDGQYWDEGDVGDLERLALIACYALAVAEETLGALINAADGAQPRADDDAEGSEDPRPDRVRDNGRQATGHSTDVDRRPVREATPAS